MSDAIVQERETEAASAYDAVPYTTYAFPQTDPRRLYCAATLFGIAAKRPTQARVLEIGCASGGNLIPLAARLPDAEFVGLDLSARQIAQAQDRAAAIGLTNLHFRCLNVCDLTRDTGLFDYIICHGVYSWVSPTIQQAILRACRAALAPNGVAFISYNTYPGWKTREILRDAMMFHTRAIAEPYARLANGRGMIDYMRGLSGETSVFSHILREEAQLVNTGADDYILHEHLERDNHPCYFSTFAERATHSGLAYLADASLPSMFAENLGPDLQRRLIAASGADQVVLEQYLDFASNRAFRQSLLVRDVDAAAINRRIDPANLRTLAFRGHLARDREGERGSATFRTAKGAFVRTDDVREIAVLDCFVRSQGSALAWLEMLGCVDPASGTGDDGTPETIAALLSRLVVSGIVEPFSEPVDTRCDGRDLPVVDTVAGQLARDGSSIVANVFHEPFVLSAAQQILLPNLDGLHSRDDLRRRLAQAVADGQLCFKNNGAPITEREQVSRMTASVLADALGSLAGACLLARPRSDQLNRCGQRLERPAIN